MRLRAVSTITIVALALVEPSLAEGEPRLSAEETARCERVGLKRGALYFDADLQPDHGEGCAAYHASIAESREEFLRNFPGGDPYAFAESMYDAAQLLGDVEVPEEPAAVEEDGIPESVKRFARVADRVAAEVHRLQANEMHSPSLSSEEKLLLISAWKDAQILQLVLSNSGMLLLAYERIDLGSGQRLRIVEVVHRNLGESRNQLQNMRSNLVMLRTRLLTQYAETHALPAEYARVVGLVDEGLAVYEVYTLSWLRDLYGE